MLGEIRRCFRRDENGLGYDFNLAELMFAAVSEADPEKWNEGIVELTHLGDELEDWLTQLGMFVPRDVDPWDVLVTMKTMMKLRQLQKRISLRWTLSEEHAEEFAKEFPVGKVFEGLVESKDDSGYWVAVKHRGEDVPDYCEILVPFSKVLGSNDGGKGKRVRLAIESRDDRYGDLVGRLIEVLS